MTQKLNQNRINTSNTTIAPKNWPFRTFNGVQTKESVKLESEKFTKHKVDFSYFEEGLF